MSAIDASNTWVRARQKIVGLLKSVLTIYLLCASILWCAQDLLLFPMLSAGFFNSQSQDAQSDRFLIETADGEKLEVRTTFATSAALSSPYVGLIFHGNGETIETGNYLPFFARHKIPAFTIDYRGYGNSTGWPREEYFQSDALTFWHAVQARTGITAQKAILLGNSIGSAPASYLASQIQPHALILIAGFASLPEVLSDIPLYKPFRWLLRYQFHNTEYLSKIRASCVLLAHGEADTTINFRHLDLLRQSVSHQGVGSVVTLTDPLASHNDIYYAVESQLDSSLESCLGGGAV